MSGAYFPVCMGMVWNYGFLCEYTIHSFTTDMQVVYFVSVFLYFWKIMELKKTLELKKDTFFNYKLSL